ncbi:MAG TPA: NADAR family protein [Myxococcaceae bacterium]|nr:NADAR family protein [Myxococcaceae bacterium]
MIDSFTGANRFLSNFHPARVVLYGVVYPTVEHAFQAAKTLDPIERARVAAAPSPGAAKRLGRRVALRPDWEEVKEGVMLALLRQKFADATLSGLLARTEDAVLVEGNTWNDRVWGAVWEDDRWVGQNLLGLLLSGVRDEVREAAGGGS